MGATNLTPNLHLPLFTDDDKPTWLGDVNHASSVVDSAYGALQAQIATLTTQLNTMNVALSTLTARVTSLASLTGHSGV